MANSSVQSDRLCLVGDSPSNIRGSRTGLGHDPSLSVARQSYCLNNLKCITTAITIFGMFNSSGNVNFIRFMTIFEDIRTILVERQDRVDFCQSCKLLNCCYFFVLRQCVLILAFLCIFSYRACHCMPTMLLQVKRN